MMYDAAVIREETFREFISKKNFSKVHFEKFLETWTRSIKFVQETSGFD